MPLLDCFDQYCCNNETGCDEVCPRNSKFAKKYAEVGGFDTDSIESLYQGQLALPSYMPMVHHGSSRSQKLNVPYAVVSLFQLFRIVGDRAIARFDNSESIRHYFKLSDETKLVLGGTGKDKNLERYWRYRRSDELVDYISRLGVSCVIGLNYSSFLDVPRTDVLFNRKRQSICLSELSEEGVSVIPHLSVTMPSDWDFWTLYLRRNLQVQYVAFNFQTGYRNRLQGELAIRAIKELEGKVGRPLIPILIGGAQFIGYCSNVFPQFSLTDSLPFAKTMHRHSMQRGFSSRIWDAGISLFKQPLDELMQHNVDSYAEWVKIKSRPVKAAS